MCLKISPRKDLKVLSLDDYVCLCNRFARQRAGEGGVAGLQGCGVAFRLIFKRRKSSLPAVRLPPSRGSSPNDVPTRSSSAGFIRRYSPTKLKSSSLTRVILERAEEVKHKAREAVHMQGRVPSWIDLGGARNCQKRPTPSKAGRLTRERASG